MLVHFYWQAVGVLQEEEAATGIFVRADGLVPDAHALQLGGGLTDVVHLEGEVPQACRFGMRRARRR